MIQPDRCDRRDIRIDQIGGIEPPAQPNLEYCEFHSRTREQIERRERAKLEVSERGIAAGSIDPFKCANELGIGRLGARDADALVVALQVR